MAAWENEWQDSIILHPELQNQYDHVDFTKFFSVSPKLFSIERILSIESVIESFERFLGNISR